MGFDPKLPGLFHSFRALGDLWGTYFQDDTKAVLTLLHGSFTLKQLKLNKKADLKKLPVSLKEGDILEIPFAE